MIGTKLICHVLGRVCCFGEGKRRYTYLRERLHVMPGLSTILRVTYDL
jgi:hypothetical protein